MNNETPEDFRDSGYYQAFKKVRKTWAMSPVERVVPSKKKFNRSKTKQNFRKELDSDD